jgi:hypothetical protein
VAFEKLSNHNTYISAEDIEDLLGADATELSVRQMLEEKGLDPSAKIFFNQVL